MSFVKSIAAVGVLGLVCLGGIACDKAADAVN